MGIVIAIISPAYPGHIDYWADLVEESTEEESPQEEPLAAEETGLQAAYDHQLLDENGDPLEEPDAKEASVP